MVQLTIGLPVYNGAKTLARSLDNLLAQTHSDFVVLISDNASTDETGGICKEYMRRDSRIRYVRQPATVVWNENFRAALTLAKTPYFMWMTHDDIWHPRFAEENIRRLECDPAAVCSVSKIVYFDGTGNDRLSLDTSALTGTVNERMRNYFLRMDSCGRFYGVYRTAILQESFPANLRVFGTDWLVVALTLLRGTHLEVEEVLLEREDQPEGHYFRRFGRTDRFDPLPFEVLWPMRRLHRELHDRLPTDVWREIRWPLRYIDLRMLVSALAHFVPGAAMLSRPLRKGAARMVHRRWQKARIV
jgi:glycosyltransferase involved in cell wall biosynthesis